MAPNPSRHTDDRQGGLPCLVQLGHSKEYLFCKGLGRAEGGEKLSDFTATTDFLLKDREKKHKLVHTLKIHHVLNTYYVPDPGVLRIQKQTFKTLSLPFTHG